MRKLLALLAFVPTLALAITFEWDGVNDTDLAGYRLYQNGVMVSNIPTTQTGGTVRYTYPDQPPGTYRYVVTAFDQAGNESAPSNEVTHVFLDVTAPGAPGNLRVVP